MNLPEICIKRPVLATVLSLVLIVVGVFGYKNLDTRFLPKFESKHIRVSAYYPGGSAALVESSITTPLEESISGIEGIDTITSTSYAGKSKIVVALKEGLDTEEVANKIRTAVENTKNQLPSNLDSPEVQIGGNSGELMDIGVYDPGMSLDSMRDYLQRYVIDRIKQLPGISAVEVMGAQEYVMQIRLDPAKMAARGISINQVTMAIQNANLEMPAGQIKGNVLNYPITAKTKINTKEQFNNVVIRNTNGDIVKIKDIGYAAMQASTQDASYARLNGHPAVLLSISNSDDSNPIDTANGVTNYIKSITPQLPEGMKIVTAYDQSDFMKSSVSEVYEAIFIAVLCVVLVIFLFLGEFRTVTIPIVTIPICLMATFGMMYLLGLTINILTLLALVLSIGLVVDDSIVMLENIYRHIEQGEKPLVAAIKGSKEIGFAVIAMTLTLTAVYAPFGLMHGKMAVILKPFAFTLAGAVIISGFIALTLSPMMCGKMLRYQPKKKGYAKWLGGVFAYLERIYQRFLTGVLRKRYIVVIVTVGIIAGGMFLVKDMPKTFMPTEDVGLLISTVNAPSGSNIDYLQKQTDTVSNFFRQEPGMKSVMSIAGTDGESFNISLATLKSFTHRQKSAQQVANDVNAKIAQVPGLNARAFPPTFGGSLRSQIEFYVMGTGTYKDLYHATKVLMDKLGQYPGLKNVQSSVKYDSQQFNITVNRQLAANLNVSVKDIDNTIAAMLGGLKISTIDIDGKTYDVDLQGIDSTLHDISTIKDFYVSNDKGDLIPLSNLVNVSSVLTQTTLPHYNRLRSAEITAQLGPGYSLGPVVQYLQANLPQLLPSGYNYAFEGMAKNVVDSSNTMGLMLALAAIFIYLVLSAQFESFTDPFIILLVVPLSLVGALISLELIHGSINIYTIVGLVTLIGLVAKHGILITQFANQLRDDGEEVIPALIKASATRLRPILMTTAAMIIGALPLVFASGASAASRQQIGIVITGGLFFGTFFSLVLVPVAYSFANSIRQFFKRRRAAAQERA